MDSAVNAIPDSGTNEKRPALERSIVVVAGLLLVGLCLPAIKTEYWIGRREEKLLFTVADSESREPVARAEITVFPGPSEPGVGVQPPEPEPADPRMLSVSTGHDGRAEALCTFDAYGHTGIFADWGRVRFGNRYVRVTATGYQPNQFRLAERTGEQREFRNDSPIELLVELKPVRKTGADGFE
jgi:hypothetical protein